MLMWPRPSGQSFQYCRPRDISRAMRLEGKRKKKTTRCKNYMDPNEERETRWQNVRQEECIQREKDNDANYRRHLHSPWGHSFRCIHLQTGFGEEKCQTIKQLQLINKSEIVFMASNNDHLQTTRLSPFWEIPQLSLSLLPSLLYPSLV